MRVIFVFPVHADFSGLLHFFSAVCPLGTPWSSCLSDSFSWENTLHILPCMCCVELSFHFTTCWKKKTKKPASQQCPKSPGKDIHQHRPASPLGCLSVLVPLIKPHRFLFIKIMPRKPGILPKVRVQQNAKEELRHTGRKHSKSVQIRLPIFIQKTPKCKGVDQSFK